MSNSLAIGSLASLVHTTSALKAAHALLKRLCSVYLPWNRHDSATGNSMVSATAVANRLLELSGYRLTPMQILKMVFLSHGYMLGIYNRPLIKEGIEAWKYGPVIPDLYHAAKKFRGASIREPLPTRRGEKLNAEQRAIVDQVYQVYGGWTGPQLSHLTHKRGSPWHDVFADGKRGVIIRNDAIKKYYARRAAGAAA